jgi:hypothetical protein
MKAAEAARSHLIEALEELLEAAPPSKFGPTSIAAT